MEQKKILLVVISVGVFLVVAIGAAILVFGNNNISGNVIAARPIPAGASGSYTVPDPALRGYSPVQDAVLGQGDISQIPQSNEGPLPAENSAPASGDTETAAVEAAAADVAANAPAAVIAEKPAAEDNAGDSPVTISVTRPTTAAVPDVPPAPRTARPAAPRAAAKPPAAQPASVAPAVSSAPKTYNDFWVQTGSFSTVARAEGVKSDLAAKGITSIIENRVIDGAAYYRVRVGPYTSQNEADYWLSLIKSINGFEDSQVWQSPSIH